MTPFLPSLSASELDEPNRIFIVKRVQMEIDGEESYLFIIEDVTEQQVAQKLRDMIGMNEKQKFVTKFVNNQVSLPLQKSIKMVDDLLEDDELDPQIRLKLLSVNSANRVAQLSSGGMLTLQQTEMFIRPKLVPTTITDMLQEIDAIFRDDLERKKIKIKKKIGEECLQIITVD